MNEFNEKLPRKIELIHDVSTLRGFLMNKDVLPDEFIGALMNILDYADEKLGEEHEDYFTKF